MSNEEEYLLSSIEAYEGLAECDFEKHAPVLVEYYERASEYYEYCEKWQEAAYYYLKTIDIYSKLAKKCPVFICDINHALYGLCLVYLKTDQIDEAKEYISSYYETYNKLNDDSTKDCFADWCVKAGAFYYKINDFEKSQEYFFKATKLFEELEEKYAEEFTFALTSAYFNNGLVLQALNSKNANESYMKACDLCAKHYESNLNAYINVMVSCCCNMAASVEYEQIEVIKKHCINAIEMCRKLRDADLDAFADAVSKLYLVTATLFVEEDIEKAKAYNRMAISIREKNISQDDYGNYVNLTNCYNNMAVLYYDNGENDNAKEYYFKAVERYLKLVKDDSEQYTPCIATILFSLGNLSEEPEEKADFHKKALALAKKYPEHPYCAEIIEKLE